ncbi:hypothetical protein IQ268_16905 [Oculatella sp. LEGE 06141]|uniref:hypothetical protein n=1 Tax=Oculatella sp. LEGE 06141 TaxID=1828648 RepID=UPI0018803394|nr:hypothetical protein [Oculatella sp. LEGE 06141]MBE9180245.1 hypothetical protein [Oculatella sp. LEGE 06141]
MNSGTTKIQIGDRVACYKYTPPNATEAQAQALVYQWRTNGCWQPPGGDNWNKHRAWGNWVIVVLRIEGDNAIVSSSSFSETLQREGIVVPLTNVELIQSNYGIPKPTVKSSKKATGSMFKTEQVTQTSLI